MRYDYTSPGGHDVFRWGRPRSTIISSLILINLIIWGLIALSGTDRVFYPIFGLVPKLVWSRLMIWQPFTYMFLHGGFWHFALNMFVLWMFGSELEREWGSTAFLRYYFVTGVGAGLVTMLFSISSMIPVIGASGAIYGVLLAYGLAYPNRYVYLYFMFPVKVKYFVGFLGIMAFLASFQQGLSTVSHLTHLSGMVIGGIYLKSGWRDRLDHLSRRVTSMRQQYQVRRDSTERQEEELMRRQVDEILDKISTEGFSSLTNEEQDILYKASIRFSRKTTKD
ncbi:rhomboid family intramembrane serine protease [Candidatus Neomarinimicrobiota bacterium]